MKRRTGKNNTALGYRQSHREYGKKLCNHTYTNIDSLTLPQHYRISRRLWRYTQKDHNKHPEIDYNNNQGVDLNSNLHGINSSQ